MGLLQEPCPKVLALPRESSAALVWPLLGSQLRNLLLASGKPKRCKPARLIKSKLLTVLVSYNHDDGAWTAAPTSHGTGNRKRRGTRGTPQRLPHQFTVVAIKEGKEGNYAIVSFCLQFCAFLLFRCSSIAGIPLLVSPSPIFPHSARWPRFGAARGVLMLRAPLWPSLPLSGSERGLPVVMRRRSSHRRPTRPRESGSGRLEPRSYSSLLWRSRYRRIWYH